MLSLLALLAAMADAPERLAANTAVPVATVALASAVAPADTEEDTEICRTRFRRGSGIGLAGQNRSVRVCKTRAEWAKAAD